MCDVWLIYPNKIEEQDYVSAAILNTLKRAARDRSKAITIATIGLMFKLLEHFAAEKNNYAAVVYKTLTFSVIENYSNLNMREFLLRNFKLLYENNPTIPVGILLEPLLKQMQGDETTALYVNVFDFEFFGSVVKHPKFTEAQALQIFYIMADVYLNNIAFSKESHKIILDILGDHIKSEALQEAVTKFVKASLAMFYSSEKNKRPKQKTIAPYNNSIPFSKPIPAAEAEAETIKAQKRAMIIQILKAILSLDDKSLNEKCKTFILYTHVQLKTQMKTEHKGILLLISLLGDANELVSQFEKEFRANRTDGDDPQSPDKVGDLGAQADAIKFLRAVGSGNKSSPKKLAKGSVSESTMKKIPKADPKIQEELDMIQREFQLKKLKKIEEDTYEKEKVDRQKKKLKTQLDKRKIELGVASKNQNNTEENIIFEEGSRALEKLLEKKHGLPEIELVNMEHEEERDKEAVQAFLKKYHKILHHLFVSYSNVGFSNQDQSSFSKIADKTSSISLVELWKMVADHDCSKYVNKEELHTLVRLVNMQLLDRQEIKNLNFQGFKDFFVQFAIFAFSRPPKDLSYMPIFVSVETLLQIFREATANKKKSTALYDDPTATEVGDKDLHAFLNDALKSDPEYPLPEVSHIFLGNRLSISSIKLGRSIISLTLFLQLLICK